MINNAIKFARFKDTFMQISYIVTIVIASTQIIDNEIFAFVGVLVFKLFSRKVLFINRKDKRN